MSENENGSIRQVQKMTLSLLKKFIQICEENQLRYYIAGGALIGAYRHNGFIPWDDDVDVIMPRKDYDSFVAIVMNGIPDGYDICNRYTDSNWHFAMSQFIDTESEVEIHLAEKPRHAHIWIDVFPIDGVPNNKFKRFIHIKRVMFYRYMIQIANLKTQVDAHRKRPWYEKAVLKVTRIIPIGVFINTAKTLDKMECILKKYDFDSCDYAGDLLGRYREKEVMPREVFGTAKLHGFEEIQVSVPENSEYFLRTIYGEYMKLPSKENQIAHGVKVIRMRTEFA